jgi:hypothetical protein
MKNYIKMHNGFLQALTDRCDEPPFESDKIIPNVDINAAANVLLDVCTDACNELILDYDSELTDSQTDILRNDILKGLKEQL